jgi:hypothetical protein
LVLNPADIVCRCYTNHALDQFLEHLLVSKVTNNIVRIGSRSKSTLLEKYNLYTILQEQKRFHRTKGEIFQETVLHKQLSEIEESGAALCETLTHGSSQIRFHQISDLLQEQFPRQYVQLTCEPDDGFTVVGVKDGSYFDYWLRAKDIRNRGKSAMGAAGESQPNTRISSNQRPRALAQILTVSQSNIWLLSKAERNNLAQHWERLLREEWIEMANGLGELSSELNLKLQTFQSEFSARALENVDVIGLTTTGLARNPLLLKRLESKTLICEEAGEVLEVSHFDHYADPSHIF